MRHRDLRFQDVRLSKHFVLLDLMHDRSLYRSGTPLSTANINADQIAGGEALCRQLLEPLVERFGPCSLSAGWCPSSAGHYRYTPHVWTRRIAACDAAFHDWVNLDRAPIKLVEQICKSGIPFERIITYAGSEFMCLAWSADPRHATYENVRVNGGQRQFISHARNYAQYARHPKVFEDRPNWRQEPSRLRSRARIRPQHVRLGRYFNFLDLTRCEAAMRRGVPWVPTAYTSAQLSYGRMFAEILDPVVHRFGRVSVVQGMAPACILSELKEGQLFRWADGPAAIQVLLPCGADADEAERQLLEDEHVQDFRTEPHASGACQLTIRIDPFVPRLAPAVDSLGQVGFHDQSRS